MPTSSSKHLALLRGINVGGKNMLPMKDLTAIFLKAGCEDVLTYIQSGNVVFRATPKIVAGLSEGIAQSIEAKFGIRIPVVLRSASEVVRVIEANPFLKAGGNEETLHVSFLSVEPGSNLVAALDSGRSAPDVFAVVGREIYLKLERGVSGTKLTNAYFDSKLKTVSTQRNWRTVLKLAEMLA